MNPQNAHILIFLIVATLFVAGSLVFAWLVRDRRADPALRSTYECGMEPVGTSWVQFNVRYYVIALIFVVFDVEAVFLFPWAVVFRQLGLIAFIEMAVFLGVLILGFVYAWKKGALEWT